MDRQKDRQINDHCDQKTSLELSVQVSTNFLRYEIFNKKYYIYMKLFPPVFFFYFEPLILQCILPSDRKM